MVSSLIEKLPDESDPGWPIEERLAQNVAFASYVGARLYNYILARRLTNLPYYWCISGR